MKLYIGGVYQGQEELARAENPGLPCYPDFHEAIRRAGPDLTRESYVAAIRTYDNFDNLITSPITFAGKSRYSHGSDKMVVYEARNDGSNKYQQITPGLVEF